MHFHLPSFLLGVATGAAAANFWDRLRPIAVELAGAGSSLGEALWNRIAAMQEDTEDAISEARAHAARRRPAARRPRRRARAAGR